MKIVENNSDTSKRKEKKKKKNKHNETENVKQEKRKRELEVEAEEVEEAPKKKKKSKKNKISPNAEDSAPKKCIFKKCFYTPTESTLGMDESKIAEFKSENRVQVSGLSSDLFKPVLNFADVNLDKKCLKVCKNFEKPTPIQSVCWPIVASGRDVVGIAETGSGKTLAFSVPALAHLMHRKENPVPGLCSGPMMLVVAPTRELAMQSQEVMEKAGKKCHLKSVCLYGGVNKHHQREILRAGVDIVVATPGRLLDLIEEGLCDLSGVSYLVLDEADRMLDQGFERDVRKIIGMTHSDRQTCLFSATWPDSIRTLAEEFLEDPIKVTIGSEDLAAGKKVKQVVEVVEEKSREFRLQKLLQKYHQNNNRILIFALYKKEAERLINSLWQKGWNCTGIHGDKSQEMRIQALNEFKSGKIPILVATDVAARGLDIPDVEYVINFSFPLTIEDYVHRIGRTGRAGKSGLAHTFFHAGDKLRAGELVNVLKESNQAVPKDMYQFDLNVKRKEHKLYGKFGPKSYGPPMKKATKIKFD